MLSIYKDHQGAIHNFENVRESLRINYFAQLLVPVIHVIITIILLRIYLSSYNKLDQKNNSTLCFTQFHNPTSCKKKL